MVPAVSDTLVLAWLTARSIARGLPVPVADYGGYRVDTNSDTEIARWVYPQSHPGLLELGQSIAAPGYFLKLCGSGDELMTMLPDRWSRQSPRCFMTASKNEAEPRLPGGYSILVERDDAITFVRILCAAGQIVASGHAVQTDQAFVYDRITTEMGHRRKGLATAVMNALGQAKREPQLPELLVATEEGRSLYESLGWSLLSLYSTASVDSLQPKPEESTARWPIGKQR